MTTGLVRRKTVFIGWGMWIVFLAAWIAISGTFGGPILTGLMVFLYGLTAMGLAFYAGTIR